MVFQCFFKILRIIQKRQTKTFFSTLLEFCKEHFCRVLMLVYIILRCLGSTCWLFIFFLYLFIFTCFLRCLGSYAGIIHCLYFGAYQPWGSLLSVSFIPQRSLTWVWWLRSLLDNCQSPTIFGQIYRSLVHCRRAQSKRTKASQRYPKGRWWNPRPRTGDARA